MDYAEVAAEVEGALKDLLGLTDNFVIPDDFLDSADNLELLKKLQMVIRQRLINQVFL